MTTGDEWPEMWMGRVEYVIRGTNLLANTHTWNQTLEKNPNTKNTNQQLQTTFSGFSVEHYEYQNLSVNNKFRLTARNIQQDFPSIKYDDNDLNQSVWVYETT